MAGARLNRAAIRSFAIFAVLAALAAIAALSALAAIAAPARAAAPDAGVGAICDDAARLGAKAHGVPLAVMRALTRTETGRPSGGALLPWPWTVNMEGEGRWFATRSEALAFARKRHAAGARSFDIGCFQINFRWHGDAFDSIDDMFDPARNASYAAAFLSEMAAEGGGWTAAAGRYHSRTPGYARAYSARFGRILAALGPAPAPSTGIRLASAPVASGRDVSGASVGAPLFARRLASLAAPIGAATPSASAAARGGVALSALSGGSPINLGAAGRSGDSFP